MKGILTSMGLALSLALAAGCTSSEEKGERDKLTAHVGKYDPAPAGLSRVKVGVPQFKVDQKVERYNFRRNEVAKDAADQLTTLADKTDRFRVIERAQMEQLLKEQGLEGVVDPEELAKPGRVKGVDYLIIGKITNMRVKGEKSKSGFDLGGIAGAVIGVPAGVFNYKNSKSTITVECGVDLRLVDPSTGTVLVAEFSEYKRTDSISATGVHILGVGGEAKADLKIDEDSRGKILRLALDDCVRKMLPRLDKRLLEAQAAKTPEKKPETPKDVNGKKCASCGAALAAEATKCAECGANVQPEKKPETPKEGKATKCASCGAALAVGATKCAACGAKVGP